MIINTTNFWCSNSLKNAGMDQCPWFKDILIEIKIKTSPIRLVNAVIIPDPRALGVW